MSTVKSILMLIKIIIESVRYLKGEISHIKYSSSIKRIKKAVDLAATGSLEGGSDVEDNFNDHAPK